MPVPTANETTSLGARVKQLMAARGLNQSVLARKSGVERSLISRMLSGKARPRIEQLDWIARVLVVDLYDLIGIADLSSDTRFLFDELCAARVRIRDLERERDEALARVRELSATRRRRLPSRGADA